MTNPYTTQTISGYNATPPADDGSQVASNQVTWAKHKTKLADPVKTLSEAINTELVTAFGTLPLHSIRSVATTDSLLVADERKLIVCTGTFTFTLLAAATATDSFTVSILNAGSGVITIDGSGTETINGQLTYLLNNQYDAVLLRCDGTNWSIVADYIGPGAAETVLTSDGTNKSWVTAGLPRSYLTGLTLSNGTDATNDINIAVGEARDASDAADLAVTTAIGKQIDVTWAAGGTVGTPTGGLSSSLTLTNGTWYHVILGKVSGTVEAGFDTSITGANLVTDHSFTNTRRIGSVRRGTATNLAFTQVGDKVLWTATILDQDVTNPGATAQTYTLTTPLGVRTTPIARYFYDPVNAGHQMVFTALDQTDAQASLTASPGADEFSSGGNGFTGQMPAIFTNTSSQVRFRQSDTNAGTIIRIFTLGYIDTRGRDA